MKIVVLGGGTAGYFTALYCKQLFPSYSITVIQNEEIGAIGVGEATTPIIIDFLNFLNIDPIAMMREIGGTVKNGIKFTDWNGDGKSYYHPFRERNDLGHFSIDPFFAADCSDYYLRHLVNKGLDFNEYTYGALLSNENKIDIVNLYYALHFDANRLSQFLKKTAADREIRIIDGNYKDVETDNNGFINKVLLDDGQVKCDFLFDCSGLARLIIGKHFKEEWISYKSFLPMKKAIPFHLPADAEKKPYTESIAMPNGWMWKIPLVDRTGGGYVFDSDYITPEEAQKEAEDYLGHPVKVSRVIDFDTGRFKNIWVKNCMAVGLSTGFLEPLEATSLHVTITQLQKLTHFINTMHVYDQNSVELYNKLIVETMDVNAEFVYLHYITRRTDTQFWKDLKIKYPPPNNFKKILDIIHQGNIRFIDLANQDAFPLCAYLSVCNGLELFENRININGYENLYPSVDQYKATLDEYQKNAISLNDFLNQGSL
jgi:tryptophan halogenase